MLVVADRPAAITIPHWTRSIAGFGDGGLRWCVTTWDRLAKVTRSCRFDVVVADEAHMVRHTTTQRWKHWKAVSGAGRVKDAPVRAGRDRDARRTRPLELPYLAPQFAVRHGEALREWADLPTRLAAHGFHVERGRYGWAWTEDADERRADLARLQGWLADADPPATLHRPAPWGPVSVTGTPVALTPAERAAYESEWSEFRAEMQLARRAPAERQGPRRAAAVPAEGRADPRAGHRRLGEGAGRGRAAGRGVGGVRRDRGRPDPRGAAGRRASPVAGIYGRDRFDVEAERLRFQRGEAPVCVFTVTASISLHAGELLPGRPARLGARRGSGCSTSRGSPASRPARSPAAPTATGKTSPWRIAFAEDTVEEQVARVMVERLAVSGSAAGADTSSLQEIAELLDADWLPATALTD